MADKTSKNKRGKGQNTKSGLGYLIKTSIIGLIAFFVLSDSAWATAPRFSPTMFQKKAEHTIEIYACESPPYISSNLPEKGVHAEIVQAVLKEAGVIKIDIKILPAKSLVKYAFTQDNAVAVIGHNWQSSDQEKKNEIWIPFAMITIKVWDKPVSIIFNKKNEKGLSLANQFKNGLLKIQQNGTYLKILQKYYGEKDSLELYLQNLETHQKETEKSNVW